MLSNVRSDIGEVEFLDSDGSQYSFDSPLPYYESVAVLLNSDGSNGGRVYRKAEPDYQVQWKFMETGATDKVRARLTLTKEGREEIRQPERMVFKTPAESGSVTLPSEYNPADGTYTVTVTGTQPDTRQTVLALYPYSGTYFCLGMLDIDTRQRKTAKVCLVNLGGDYERSTIESGINNIYNKAGISWQVTEEVGFTYPQDSLALLFDTKESGGSLYNQRQKSLNAAFASYMAERYDSGTCYLFLYSNPKGSKSRDVAGYMPRGGQFGYINTARLSQTELPAVAAHELGHGRFRLRHIFDGDYGTVASRQKGRTDNLMDYASNPAAATHIAKWQWAQLHDPALLTEAWERPEEGEWVAQLAKCLIAATIDVTMNYSLTWLFMVVDGKDVEFTDYDTVFDNMHTSETVLSAGIACAESLIPINREKIALVSAYSAAMGSAATAMAGDIEEQYIRISDTYPDKRFKEVLSLIDWQRAFKTAGVQAVISGVSAASGAYIATHPKVKTLVDGLKKKVSYEQLRRLLEKARFTGENIEQFCSNLGIVKYVVSETDDAIGNSGVRATAKTTTGTIIPITKKVYERIKNATGAIGNVVYTKDGKEVCRFEGDNIILPPKGSRPDPKEYLTPEYIEQYLEMFKDGASCLALENVKKYPTLGRNDGLFVLPRNKMDELLEKAKGDINFIEEKLGIPSGVWKEELQSTARLSLVRIDIKSEQILNLRLPTGNELGANSKWIPAGYTDNGLPEAVINPIQWNLIDNNQVTTIILK